MRHQGPAGDPGVPHPTALTDVLQEEGQDSRGSSQRVPGRHVELVGSEGKHLQVPEGAAPRAREGALTCVCAVPGDTGTAAKGWVTWGAQLGQGWVTEGRL